MMKVQIGLAWLILSCGQIIFWRRRDNIFGYLQAGFFFVSILVPIFGTAVLAEADQAALDRYADIMLIGALAYLLGLFYGAWLGNWLRLPRLIFAAPLDRVSSLFVRRTRQVAAGGLGALALSFLLLGYIPLLAGDRTSAKYGVGPYRAGFARGSLVVHVGLILGGTVLPVMLVLLIRHRRQLDLLLTGGLLIGLVVTLSRNLAFTGPLVFLIALAIERSWRPWRILSAVCFAFLSSILFNELISIGTTTPGTTFASRVAASAPDLDDNVDFLSGYQAGGGEQLGLKPLLATLSLDKGTYNPAIYALRVRTGLADVTEFPAGGVRLPAPLWGYVAYGYPGVAVWSLLSGVAIGCGTSILRRALSGVHGNGRQCLNIVLAWVFFEGTFQVLGAFFLFERVALVSLGMALFLCSSRLQLPANARAPNAVDTEMHPRG